MNNALMFPVFLAGLALSAWAGKKLAGQTPLIVAHRGASYDAPENTLPAFELAWKKNADAIEGDFYLTKDNQIVCIHDRTTKRYSKVNLDVAASTLSELRKLDVGAYKHARFAGTKIPTLNEVLATIPTGKKIYIEVKCGPEIVPFLIKELTGSELRPEQIVFISFNADVIQSLKRKSPKHTANWLCGFKKEKDGRIVPSYDSVLKTLKRIKADGFSSSRNHIDQSFVRKIQQEGYAYHVWTVNDAATARKFKSWNAGSITTDRPALIRESIFSTKE